MDGDRTCTFEVFQYTVLPRVPGIWGWARLFPSRVSWWVQKQPPSYMQRSEGRILPCAFQLSHHILGVPITWGHDTEKAQSCGVGLKKKAKHPRQSAPQSRMSLCVAAASRVVEPVEYQ